MIPVAIAMGVLGGLGALGGGLAGVQANAQRSWQANRDWRVALAQYNAQKARADSQRGILEGNLNIASLQGNEQNRAAAIQKLQSDAQAKAQAGLSGASAGTPFFQIAQQIQESTRALSMTEYQSALGADNAGREYTAGTMGIDAQLLASELQVGGMLEDLQYLESPVAAIMAGATGAMSGASTGMQLASAGVSMGIFGESLLPVAKAGAAAAAGSTLMGEATRTLSPATTDWLSGGGSKPMTNNFMSFLFPGPSKPAPRNNLAFDFSRPANQPLPSSWSAPNFMSGF